MPFAEVNGQRIRFEDSGGDGPPVVFSHGFLMDREMFAPQVVSIGIEQAEQLSAALPGCNGLVRIEGAPHASNLTHPDDVNDPLLEFLRSL